MTCWALLEIWAANAAPAADICDAGIMTSSSSSSTGRSASTGRGSAGRGSTGRGSAGRGSPGRRAAGRGAAGRKAAGRRAAGRGAAGRGAAAGGSCRPSGHGGWTWSFTARAGGANSAGRRRDSLLRGMSKFKSKTPCKQTENLTNIDLTFIKHAIQ